MIETVRINSQGLEQLSRLKRRTGIETRNILCRWAFCASLSEPTPPPPRSFKGEMPVEMSWRVFGGKDHELYLALLKDRCVMDGLGTSEKVLAEQFRLHVHRGLSYLAADKNLKSIAALLRRATDHTGSPDDTDANSTTQNRTGT